MWERTVRVSPGARGARVDRDGKGWRRSLSAIARVSRRRRHCRRSSRRRNLSPPGMGEVRRFELCSGSDLLRFRRFRFVFGFVPRSTLECFEVRKFKFFRVI